MNTLYFILGMGIYVEVAMLILYFITRQIDKDALEQETEQ